MAGCEIPELDGGILICKTEKELKAKAAGIRLYYSSLTTAIGNLREEKEEITRKRDEVETKQNNKVSEEQALYFYTQTLHTYRIILLAFI